MNSNALSPANYLASLINDGETETAGTNYLFSDMNSFLIFESVRFSDEARAQYIKKMFKISGMLYPDILTSRVCMEAMYSSMSLKTTYGSILPDDMTLTRQLLSCRFLWTVPMLNVILCSACEVILRIKTISTTHREAKGGKHERCYCKKENPQTIRQRADIHDR